jgi:hypothetical protein
VRPVTCGVHGERGVVSSDLPLAIANVIAGF